MTLQDLEDYAGVRREIKQTQERLKRIYAGSTVAHDSVKGSSNILPYQEHIITVHGIPVKDIRFAEREARRLRARIVKYKHQTEAVEAFIDTLDDTVIRQIIALRYIDGLEWRQVARRVYGNYNENTPRMRIQRFFENI